MATKKTSTVTIKLVKSTIGCKKDQIATVEALGLHKVGETVTLTATVNDGLTPALTWESDNTAVATVANGVVTAVKAGTANITVTAAEGVTATAVITVEEAEVSTVLYGDVDGNGEVKNKDVITLARFLAEWPAYAVLPQ